MKKGGTRSGKVAMPEPQEEEDKYGIAEETPTVACGCANVSNQKVKVQSRKDLDGPFYCDGNSPHTLLKK
jgi:hypothetical protein